MRIPNAAPTWAGWPLVLGSLIAVTGCQPMSTFAYRCGVAFDPATQADKRCGLLHKRRSPEVEPVHFTQTISPETLELRAQTDFLRSELAALQQRVDELTAEVVHRKDSLIAARAEVAQLRGEFGGLQQDIQQWHHELGAFRESLLARNADQVRQIRELANAIERLGTGTAEGQGYPTDPFLR